MPNENTQYMEINPVEALLIFADVMATKAEEGADTERSPIVINKVGLLMDYSYIEGGEVESALHALFVDGQGQKMSAWDELGMLYFKAKAVEQDIEGREVG